MSDETLKYYEQELAYIQQAATDFAKQHPKIAGRLQIGDNLQDPWVERLLSGVAFLNARIQKRLDDDFPELTEGILTTLYPHYLRPIPSMAIAQFVPADDLDGVNTLPRNTNLRYEMVQASEGLDESCEFETRYPTQIAPLEVVEAKLMTRPFIAPAAEKVSEANGVLRVRLKAVNDAIDLGAIELDQLRFYLKGQAQHVYPLHELLLNRCTRVVIAKNETDTRPIILDAKESIREVGFANEDGLIPYPGNSFMGYRLLTEFFVFPEKFLFVDVTQLDKGLFEGFGNELHLYFYVTSFDNDLEHHIDASNLQLGCTPVVNLFRQQADPITLDQYQHQYRVVPDARRTSTMEVYSIERVTAVDKNGESSTYTPLYGLHHVTTPKNHGTFWFSRRSEVMEGEHLNQPASEVDISIVDLHMNPESPTDQTLNLDLICCNRNLPVSLPQTGKQFHYVIIEGSAPTKTICNLVPPTSTLRPDMSNKAYWRLISHLNLNYLSLSGQDALDIFKEILRLYDFRNSSSTRTMIESLRAIKTSTTSAPIHFDSTTVMCRGTDVEITMDPRMLTGSSPYFICIGH